MSCEKAFRITSRYAHQQIFPLGHFPKKPLSAKRPCVNSVSLVWCAIQERHSRARFVRGEAPSRTAARGPSGCRSRSIVRSTTLASSHRRRNSSRCEHHDLSPCLEPLSRLPFHGSQSPPEDVHRNSFFQKDRSPTRHSQSLCLTLQPTARNATRHFAACATRHIPQVQLDRVLLYECEHRADELIGLKVDVSGEFITEFELVFVQVP